MGVYDWEPDIEWFDLAGNDLVPRINFKELPLHDVTQEFGIYYETHGRQVLMRVLGESAVGPVVLPYVLQAGGKLATRDSGIFVGSVHPDEPKLVSPHLRTKHKPLIKPADTTKNEGYFLPTPTKSMRLILPARSRGHHRHVRSKK